MTITATPSEIAYLGDAVTVAFSIPFVFDTSADIKVITTVEGEEPLEISTGFAITGGSGSTGTCTFDAAPAADVTITILDDPELTQTADYEANDAFPESTHEAALDRGVRQVKRQKQRTDRSLRVADGDPSSGDNLLVPIATVRAGKFLAFDADGQPLASSGTGGGDAALREDLAETANGSDGSRLSGYRYPSIYGVARSSHDKFRERVSVFDLGVVGDNVTDDTDRMQRATEALHQAELFIPRPATFKISDSIPRYNQSIIGCAKEYAVFNCGSGNFPCFVNSGIEFITGDTRRIGVIYNNGLKPTNAGTQSNQVAFRMATVNGKSPNFDLYEDIEVRGAWWAFYDDSGSYGSTLRSFFARACKNGFRKENGTTFHFDRAITGGDADSAGPDTAFFMNNNVAFKFTCCAADRGAPGAGNALVDFRSMVSFEISGWDSEGNAISGNDAALMSFLDSDGVVTAFTDVGNAFSENVGYVSKFKLDGSSVSLIGHRGRYSAGPTNLTMAGNGTYYGVLAQNASQATLIGGRWNAPTVASGAPTLRLALGTGTSRVHDLGIITDMTRGARSRLLYSQTDDLATITATGFTGSVTGSGIVSRENSGCELQLPALTGTSNAGTFTLTPVLDAIYRPAHAQNIIVQVVNNGTAQDGLLIIGTDGSMSLFSTPAGAAFTGSGTKGIPKATYRYSLD